MSVSPEYSKSLRLCHIIKWDHFDGYGFNLHAEKGKLGQYIGKVDEGSPAEAAGLKEGDRIIEVNDVNIHNENHKQVVMRIKAVSDETKLLVVDREGDVYFKSEEMDLNSSLPFVTYCKTPSYNIEKKISEIEDVPVIKNNNGNSVPSGLDEKKEKDEMNNLVNSANSNSLENNEQNSSLNLNMTAKELRAKLAAKKKYDPKKDYSLDVKKKYDIVQKL